MTDDFIAQVSPSVLWDFPTIGREYWVQDQQH